MFYFNVGRLLTIFVAVYFSVISSAYAYLDPGSGSLILQGIIAGIAGGIFALKNLWHKIIFRFKGRKNQSSDHEDDNPG